MLKLDYDGEGLCPIYVFLNELDDWYKGSNVIYYIEMDGEPPFNYSHCIPCSYEEMCVHMFDLDLRGWKLAGFDWEEQPGHGKRITLKVARPTAF